MANKYNNKKDVALKGTEKEVYAEAHSLSVGPIPSAAEFAQYKDVMPDLPERIVKQFEADSENARELMRIGQKADIDYDKKCLMYAFIIIMTGMLGTMLLAYTGNNVEATALAVGTVCVIFKGLFNKK